MDVSRPVQQKSTYDIWRKWAKVLARQLDQISDVYEYHEEGAEAKRVDAFLVRLKLFIDPLKNAQDLAKRDYDVRGSVKKLYLLSLTMLHGIFYEALKILPEISDDMQRLLNSPCFGECNGRTASDIFKGPHGSTNEGIMSGIPDERGGLPFVLAELIEKADIEGEAYFAIGLDEETESSSGDDDGSSGGPSRSSVSKTRVIATSGGFA
jgi:hypothetical protein